MILMPVKIFVPKIPPNDDEFVTFVKKLCNPSNIRISKNKDGTSFCVISLNYNDKVRCANDVIKEINGKTICETLMKPRIYVDQSLFFKLKTNPSIRESHDDVVNTTHYSDGYYYIQLLGEKESNRSLTEMLNKLYVDFDSDQVSTLVFEDIAENKLYATFYNDDCQLYRIRVLEKLRNSSQLKVEFIDYGNEEIIHWEQSIIPINENIAQIQPMAHKCVIMDVKIENPSKHALIAREILHRNYRAKLVKEKNSDNVERVVGVDFIDFTSVSYRSYLVMEDVATETNYGTSNKTESSGGCNGFKQDSIPVILTHFESLEEFYVQVLNKTTNDNMTTLSMLIQEFNDEYQSKDLCENDAEESEQVYIGQFSQDDNWYRCKLVKGDADRSDNLRLVQYIDFGNTELKSLKMDLRRIKDGQLAQIPPCAHQCKFSEDLVYALSSAKLEKEYFTTELVQTEQVINLTFYHDRASPVWVVDNMILSSGEDIQTIVLQRCENRETVDLYRLGNLESLDKAWFQLVKAVDPIRQNEISLIEKLSSKEKSRKDEPVKNIEIGSIYCAKFSLNTLGNAADFVRCKVLARNRNTCIVQSIDYGCYDTVTIDAIYPLDSTVENIDPMANMYKFQFKNICAESRQIEEKISNIIGTNMVKLNLIEDETGAKNLIRDVIINRKSLSQCLALLDYIQPVIDCHDENNNTDQDNKFRDLPECLLPEPGNADNGGVDFSLPSVEKMDEVPMEIAILNSHVRLMRHMYPTESPSLFDQMFALVDNCKKLAGLIDCCDHVADLGQSFDSLETEFTEVVCNIKSKIRDLDPLIDRRKELCETICKLHEDLDQLLEDIPLDKLDQLLLKIDQLLVSTGGLMEILSLNADLSDNQIDIESIRNQVEQFRQSDSFHELQEKINAVSVNTDNQRNQFMSMLNDLCRDYQIGEPLLTSTSAVVPLIDRTFELHASLKVESSTFINLFSSHSEKSADEEGEGMIDIHPIIRSFHAYLTQERISLSSIVNKVATLDKLYESASLALLDDSALFQSIEQNHKLILGYRSSLKHKIADIEDAEEQDEREKIDQISEQIESIRQKLHIALQISEDVTKGEASILMHRKPELQLKNQSVLFSNNEGSVFPIFLWDSIYFDIPRSHSSSVASVSSTFSDYFSTRFGKSVVSMRRLVLSFDNYHSVLRNLSTYASQVTVTSPESVVSLLPISLAFLSRSEGPTVYLVLPSAVGIHQRLPESANKSLRNLVTFFQSMIDQILSLWHHGFTFTDEDLDNGLFLSPVDNPSYAYLPLPLCSILNREDITQDCASSSLLIYFSKLATLLQESLSSFEELENIDPVVINELVENVGSVSTVTGAETAFQELDSFLTTVSQQAVLNASLTGAFDVANENGDHDSSNGNASSIEQLQPDEEDLIQEIKSPVKEVLVTEHVLETISDVE